MSISTNQGNTKSIDIVEPSPMFKAIARSLTMSRETDIVQLICPKTGIVTEMRLPHVPGLALTAWTSPLASFKTIYPLIEKGLPYLKSCDLQILAGFFLTVFSNYSLLQIPNRQSSAENNALVSQAGSDILIDALMLSNRLHSENVKHLPALSLDLNTYSMNRDIAWAIRDYTKTITKILWPDPKDLIRSEIEELKLTGKDLTIRSMFLQRKKAEYEEPFKKQIMAGKKRIKEILSNLADANIKISDSLLNLLKNLSRRDSPTLVSMDDSIRTRLVSKLYATGIPGLMEISNIIEEAENPFDVLGDIEELAATEISAMMEPAPKRIMSIAELLAQKKMQESLAVSPSIDAEYTDPAEYTDTDLDNDLDNDLGPDADSKNLEDDNILEGEESDF